VVLTNTTVTAGNRSSVTRHWTEPRGSFAPSGTARDVRLLAQLSQGEMCVTEIAGSEGETLSTISQRLRVLRSENLVIRKRRGKHINYALADQHVMDLLFNALAHASEAPDVPAPDEIK